MINVKAENICEKPTYEKPSHHGSFSSGRRQQRGVRKKRIGLMIGSPTSPSQLGGIRSLFAPTRGKPPSIVLSGPGPRILGPLSGHRRPAGWLPQFSLAFSLLSPKFSAKDPGTRFRHCRELGAPRRHAGFAYPDLRQTMVFGLAARNALRKACLWCL